MSAIHLLEIEFSNNGQSQLLTPVLFHDEHDTILVDCGYPDFMGLLAEAAARYGIQLDSITRLIVTHHDIDHIGSLAALRRTYPQMVIVAHELEVPFVEGQRKSLRLEQALSDVDRVHAELFIHFLQSIEPAPVDQKVAHAEKLPWCGGIEIVHTPGHTPGHISLYLPASKTLIAGDAVVIEDGKLAIANPQYTLDMDEAIRSIQRLLTYDIEQIVCYHGGLFLGDVKQALRQLLLAYSEGEHKRRGEIR